MNAADVTALPHNRTQAMVRSLALWQDEQANATDEHARARAAANVERLQERLSGARGKLVRRAIDREVRVSLRAARDAKTGTKAHAAAYAEALRWAARSEAAGGSFAVQVNATTMGGQIVHQHGGDRVVELGDWMPRAKRRKSRIHMRNGRTGAWS